MPAFFGESKPKYSQYDTLNAGQKKTQDIYNQGLQGSSQNYFDWYNKLLSGDPGALNALDEPLMRQFNEEVIPSIAERFTSLGAQGSSSFGQAAAHAGQSLMGDLGAQRQNFIMNATDRLGQFQQGAFTPSFGTNYEPRSRGFGLDLLQTGVSAAVGGAAQGYASQAGQKQNTGASTALKPQ